ncbi:MAG: hypothetical protein JWO91_23 [Acidobacteriaceae bacterium]|nr:hypothetical protein [Acidobacteriaceae bacterium]
MIQCLMVRESAEWLMINDGRLSIHRRCFELLALRRQ